MSHLDQTAPADVERLPEFWPDAPPSEPVRAWWIPWPVSVVIVPLLWVMPRRMGPHFAAVRWPGVIVGHLFWTIYGLACIDLAYWAPYYGWVAWLTGRSPGQAEPGLWPPPGAWDIFRAPLALVAFWLGGEVVRSLEAYFTALGVFGGVELAIAAGGVLLMPFAAGGERGRRLLGRCVKLTLWATTSVVVLGLAIQATVVLLDESPYKRAAIIAACGLYAGWFMWIWLRAGMRYAGRAEGPGWSPRRPRCEGCGYILTGLTPADRCPECGREVALSLPERRRPTAYQTAVESRRRLARIPAFVRTAAFVLAARAPFRRIALHGAHPAARGFAVRMCLLASAVAAGMGVHALGYYWIGRHQLELNGPAEWAAVFLAGWMGLFVVMVALTGFFASVSSDWACRRIQQRASVAFYHTVWWLPVGIMLLWSYMADTATVGHKPPFPFPYSVVYRRLPAEWLAAGVIVAALALIGFALVRIRAAVWSVRFANG